MFFIGVRQLLRQFATSAAPTADASIMALCIVVKAAAKRNTTAAMNGELSIVDGSRELVAALIGLREVGIKFNVKVLFRKAVNDIVSGLLGGVV